MIISEVNAVFDLVLKATSFCTELKDGWYKGCSELDDFEDKVLMLSAKQSQWSEQLRKYGISEDKHLMPVVKLAVQALEKQQESIRKLQRSPFRRLKRRVFPGEISYYLDKILQFVDAGPEFLATKLANTDLLERHAARTPTSLPFGRDKNYVPIVSTIFEVQRALENGEASRVVTVHGGPGMGKSCLAKHVALHYVEEKQRLQMDASPQKPAVFPDGVFYILCGRQSDKRTKQLQLELLQNLGFKTASTAPIDPATRRGVQEDYSPLPSHQMKLRSRLAEQTLLIILDDLWEETVLQEVLVPAQGVKYLITSQKRDIFITAKKIQIRTPDYVEARSIMANYTDGLPIPGQFPPNIKRVTDDIIRKLEHHPLSLANIGISINSSRATDTNQWEVISANLYVHLDENDHYRPPAYDSAYSLPVSGSMMLMVESLPAKAQTLLFLITLLGGQRLPEPLVKFFYKFIQKADFAVKYISQEKFLEDKSLIENFRVGENNLSVLDCHSLRWRYIRDQKTQEVRSLASQILIASGGQDVAKPIEKGESDEALVTVLGGMYYDPVFKDIIRSTVESLVKVLNGGVISRSLNMRSGTPAGTLDHVKVQTKPLVWLLDVNHEDGIWKNQAHEYAKKIIIKFACQGKLDDNGMASLLKHPQTTLLACEVLRSMYYCHSEDFYDHNITFSSAYSEIMETLLALLHHNGTSIEQRAEVMYTLLKILNFESRYTILRVAAQYKAILTMDSNPKALIVQMISCLRRSCGRGCRILAGSSGLLEHLLGVVLFGKDHVVRLCSAKAIHNIVSGSSRLTLRVAAFPNALQVLFDLFMSVARYGHEHYAGRILVDVSIVPDNRIKLREIQGLWEGLGVILMKLEGARWETRDDEDREMLEKRAAIASSILGNLGLEMDLRDTIASSPSVRESLQFLQLVQMARSCSWYSPRFFLCFSSTEALSVLYSNPNPAAPVYTSLPPLEEVLKAFDTGPGSASILELSSLPEKCYFSFYWRRVLAYIQMGSYVESLSNLDRAEAHLVNALAKQEPELNFVLEHSVFGYSASDEWTMSKCRVLFLQAMQEDYTGALQTANSLYDFTQTGVIKTLSGDLQGALDDFNIQAANPKTEPAQLVDTLKWRGYVRYLMDDKAGARKDADLVQQMILMEGNEWGPDLVAVEGSNLWDIKKLPVNYLGYVF